MDVFGCVTGPIDECVNILKVSKSSCRQLFSPKYHKSCSPVFIMKTGGYRGKIGINLEGGN